MGDGGGVGEDEERIRIRAKKDGVSDRRGFSFPARIFCLSIGGR